MVIPQIDVYRVELTSGVPPKLVRSEPHRINMLWHLAAAIGIQEHEHAVIADDRPELAARVARQTRVSDRIDVACANSLTGVKARHRRNVTARWPSRCKHRRHLICPE